MAEIKLNHTLRQLHNKIIECKWDYDQECWSFMRERTDKSFPNAYNTAHYYIAAVFVEVLNFLIDLLKMIFYYFCLAISMWPG